jgi:uncharacterized protein YegP (UPF0339 family)
MATKKVELWEAGNGRWYFHVRERNGRNTSPSQGYAHKRTAVARIRREHPGLPIEVQAPAPS